MAEPLFRLHVIRPPAQSTLKEPAINTSQASKFQEALKQAAKTEKPYDALRSAAQGHVDGASFVKSPSDLPLGGNLTKLSEKLNRLEKAPELNKDKLIKAVLDSFGVKTLQQLVESEKFTVSISRLKDSILAIKQLQEQHAAPIEALVNQLRDLDFIANLASDKPDLGRCTTGEELAVLRGRPLIMDLPSLKSVVNDNSSIDAAQEAAKASEAKRQASIKSLVDTYKSYSSAINELTSISSVHVQSMSQTERPGFDAPEQLQAINNLKRQSNMVSKLSEISLKFFDPAQATPSSPSLLTQPSATPSGPTASTEPRSEAPQFRTAALSDPSNTGSFKAFSHITDLTLTPPTFITTSKPAFIPIDRSTLQLKLTDDKIGALSEVTKGILGKENLSLNTVPLDHSVNQLHLTISKTVADLQEILRHEETESVALKNIGGTLVAIKSPVKSSWNDILVGGFFPGRGLGNLDQRIPHTKGRLAPVGVSDLLVVRQQLKAYEGTDLSHIENVLKSEKREREHTRTQTTTTMTSRQTETTDQQTRDLESTSRFEMAKETDITIKSDQSLKAGLNVSASYGPAVTLSASVEGSTSSSRNEATKAASKFSQDVTEKSAKNITTRVQQTTTLTVTDEVVEKDTHGFDNTTGTDNISGVYQWVSKIYEAQMYNYGLRVMYDFMIPEPAAFYIAVFKQAQAAAVKLEKPADLNIRPASLREANYMTWVALFGATDVTPPPEIFKTYAKEINMPPTTDSNINFNKTDQIDIDTGYQALSCSVRCSYSPWDPSYATIVIVGQNMFSFQSDDTSAQARMSDQTGSIPISMLTYKLGSVIVNIEVKCVRTPRAFEQWQLETWGKLWNAYQARMQEYNEALAQLQLNAGIAITGKDPTTNLTLMRNEIKKNCISILTAQHFDLFDSIDTTSSSLPQIDFYQNEAEGAYVRFFEEAFEWEEMTWLTYPYFWGRKAQWAERIAFSDPDPAFDDFLKAGYCRAVAPVRPGFEGAVDHFMQYGELWMGGSLPTVSSPLYVPIAQEIAERDKKPGTEIPQGEPWEIRLPTTLVKLRKDDKLPRWTKGADGRWSEVVA